MKAKLLVAAALILAVFGFVAMLVPVTPQVLYAPVVTSHTTSYTTVSPYAVKYVEVTDDPHDAALNGSYGDIESVTYERVGDSLRINVTLSQPVASLGNVDILMFSASTEPFLYYNTWILEFKKPHNPPNCQLWKAVTMESYEIEKLERCTVTAKMLSADVPLSAIENPTKVWVQASIWDPNYGGVWPENIIDSVPEVKIRQFLAEANKPPFPSLPEVDLSPDYARTTARTFATYSTYTSTYSSAYTAMVPLAVTLPWMPVLILAAAVCLILGAVYVDHRRVRTLPSPRPALGVCPKCGTTNPPTSKFCNECGTRLAD